MFDTFQGNAHLGDRRASGGRSLVVGETGRMARYAVNDEAGTYLAIMRLFTAGISGFLSDQSADEITDRLRAEVARHAN